VARVADALRAAKPLISWYALIFFNTLHVFHRPVENSVKIGGPLIAKLGNHRMFSNLNIVE
jgi:hypothetical protein